MKQGEKANYTGNKLERFIDRILQETGYTFIENKNFEAACFLEQPIYSRQFPLGHSIYDTPLKCDFILHHPVKHQQCLVIESKWQQSPGSTDEKYPYLVLNIKAKFTYPTVIVLDGEGYRSGAKNWLRSQVGDNLIHVFNMMEFQRWSNGDAL